MVRVAIIPLAVAAVLATTFTSAASSATSQDLVNLSAHQHQHFDPGMPNDVSAVAPDDVWLSGSNGYTNWEWNGSSWQTHTDPDVSTEDARANTGLGPIKAIARDDVWAVGPRYRGVSHWDGSHWHFTGYLPNPTGLTVDIWGIDGLSADDIWVVGAHTTEGGESVPMLWHWDGTSWTARTDIPSNGTLHNVVEINPHNVWAVGSDTDEQGLVLHYDGRSWRRVETQDANTSLAGVTASGPDDVWIVGTYTWHVWSEPTTRRLSTFSEHWDGRSWSVVRSVNTLKRRWNYLTSVSAISPDDVWAVGFGADRGDSWGFPRHNLIEHWDGTAWSRVRSPHPGTLSYLGYVSADATDDVWAVGKSGTDFSTYFLLHWDGHEWQRVWIR